MIHLASCYRFLNGEVADFLPVSWVVKWMVCFVFDAIWIAWYCWDLLTRIVLDHIFTRSPNAVVFVETNMEVIHCTIGQNTRVPKQDTNRIFRIVTAPVGPTVWWSIGKGDDLVIDLSNWIRIVRITCKSEWQDRACPLLCYVGPLDCVCGNTNMETGWKVSSFYTTGDNNFSFLSQELRIDRIPGYLGSIGLTIRVIGPHAFWKCWFFTDWSCGADFFYSDNAFNCDLGLGFFLHPLYLTCDCKAMVVLDLICCYGIPGHAFFFRESLVILNQDCLWKSWQNVSIGTDPYRTYLDNCLFFWIWRDGKG